MKKITVAFLSVVLIISSMSVQAKSSTGKTIAWAAAGAIAGYALKSAMSNEDNNTNQNYQSQNYNQNQNVYQTSDGCVIKVTQERLTNGDIREVKVKRCRNNNY